MIPLPETRTGVASAWRRAGWISTLLALLAVGRLAMVAQAAITNNRGDYYASLPGTYVRDINPTLWHSPDMQGAMGYLLNTYYHGPTQYLTLYPVAYLDSYEQIAAVLLVLYAVLLGAAFWCLTRALAPLAPGVAIGAPLFATTFLFFPLLQTYLQREFEIVLFLGLTFALMQLQRHQFAVAGAVLGYLAWFKYIPLLVAGYLALRGWFTAVAGFILASVAVIAATHLAFGLPEFFNNNVPNHAAQIFNVVHYGFAPDAGGVLRGSGFCNGWFATETTLANIRHGLCALASTNRWMAPNVVYLLICVVVAVTGLHAYYRLSRGPALSADEEAWRRALEFSIVTTVCACFFFAHFYYLIVLVIPYGVLLVRCLATRDRRRLAWWLASYVLVSAFVVPTGVLSRLSGIDVWAWYFDGAWFLYGELLLIGLLLFEYRSLASQREVATSRAATLS